MYIDSLSLTWYLVGAESKILKQSKLQEVRHDSEACKMLVNIRRSVRGQVLVHARGEMSAYFANVTSITACNSNNFKINNNFIYKTIQHTLFQDLTNFPLVFRL